MNKTAFLPLLLLGVAAPAFAQTAILADGRVLTIKQPLELFLTEGPIWDLNVDARSFVVTGKTVTIPASINGATVTIAGTAVTNAAGETVDAIGAHNFDRLLDQNAVARDTNAYRSGAVRSIFSTIENQRQDSLRPATRNLTAQEQMQSNYFATTRDIVPMHDAVLPAAFGSTIGFLGQDSTTWVYPASSGGTLKSAGHVYLDAAGNSFFIPDQELAFELAENVALGTVSSVNLGGNGVPTSFTMGQLLVVYNPDPRFPASTTGLIGTEIPRELFAQQAVGMEVAVGGYMVSEHVLFATVVETTLIDTSAPISVVPTNWLFKNNGNEIRIRGVVDQPQGIALSMRILNQTFPVNVVVDPISGGGVFDFRTKGQLNVANVSQVTIVANYVGAPAGTPPAFEQTYLRSVVTQ